MLDISIKGEEIVNFFGVPITNTLLMSALVTTFLIISSAWLRGRLKLVPSKIQSAVEIIFETLFSFMEDLYGSARSAEQYFPLIGTIFIFILLNNWFGVLPILGTVGLFHQTPEGTVFLPLFRSAASDINLTLALAIISIVATNIIGIATIGFFSHIRKFLNFSGIVPFFVGILEFISEIAKMVSFSFRLFGNVFAGEVLLIIVSFLFPYIVPMPFLVLEIFVGFMQALVFTMLTMVFIKLATVAHEGEHH